MHGSKIYQLVYCSSAKEVFSREQLLELARKANQFNQTVGVTGMLLHYDGSFIQVLEGEESEVLSLYEKIARDKRHTNAIIVYRKTIPEREFSEWGMAAVEFSRSQHREAMSLLSLPETTEFQNIEGSKVKKLLLAMRADLLRDYGSRDTDQTARGLGADSR